jgi:hypothetical protein
MRALVDDEGLGLGTQLSGKQRARQSEYFI